MPAIRNQVRELRAQREITQQELADRVGVTRQTVIAIEQDKYSPSLETAFKVALILGVPLEQCFQYDPDGKRQDMLRRGRETDTRDAKDEAGLHSLLARPTASRRICGEYLVEKRLSEREAEVRAGIGLCIGLGMQCGGGCGRSGVGRVDRENAGRVL